MEGKNPDDLILFENVRVDYDLLETIDVEFVEGRSFSRSFTTDTSKIIFNEKAIEVMGLDDPIGKKIRLWDQFDLEIIGVVKNFHFQSFHDAINPLFFRLDPELTWVGMIKIAAGKEKETIQRIKTFYEDFNPGFPFDFDFMDQQFARMYEAEQRVSILSRYFAGLAILISCLGLFGLASFTADRRKKEIGIRKVLGASIGSIVVLLTKDFIRLVMVATLLGLPIAFIFLKQWLDRFAYKIDLSVGFFLFAGLLVFLIAWITVGSHAIKSAKNNPIDALKYE